MDSEMKNGTHLNRLTSSLYVILKNIARIRPLLDKETTKILVQTLVLSKMDYCNSLLLETADYKFNKLQKLQNIGCRKIFGVHKYDHLSDCMKDLHWLKIKQHIQYKTAVLTYKYINKTAPKYLQDLIMMQAPRPNMCSEANGKLPILCANTSQARDSSFTMQAPHNWNALPGAIRKAATLDLFKKQIKTHLFREAYPQSASDNVKHLRNAQSIVKKVLYKCIKLKHSNHIVHVGRPHYKVPAFHIRYGWTIQVIDSDMVPTFHIRYGETISHWHLQGSHIPYKVWGPSVIDSYKVPTFHKGTIRFIDHYKVPTSYMWGTPLQGSHIPHKVWRTISHWQLQGSCMPYKVWRDHKSHWQLQGSYMQIILYMWGTPLQASCIPDKVWGDHKSLTVTRFPHAI